MVLVRPHRDSYIIIPGITISRDRGPVILKCFALLVVVVLVISAGQHRGLRDPSKAMGYVEMKPVQDTNDAVTTVLDESTADTVLDESTAGAKNEESKEVVAAVPETAQEEPRKICGREIPISLTDTDSWPTPYTPSYFEQEPTNSTAAVLVLGNYGFGNVLIIGLFHALDLAYDKKCEVYIAKDCTWIWDVMTPWFYGKDYTRDDAFYKTMEDILGVHVVENGDKNKIRVELGKPLLHALNSRDAYRTRGTELTAEQMRNRRDTIFRKLFALPNPPCDDINSAGLNKADARYTVIDVPWYDAWNEKVQEYTGHDHTAAFEMKPDYVKSILEPLDMQDQPIFLSRGGSEPDPSRDEVKRLEDDPELQTDEKDVTNDLYFAVLADVFIGNPCSHWSLMVARIRHALGIKNSFVYTEQKDGHWVSFVDQDNYLELYNSSSPWFG